MKSSPFQSSYLSNFTVLEKQEGNRTIYPHPDQLPRLARALKLEFESVLPARIKRVDERADDFHKIERKTAVDLFCHLVNASRSDGLQLVGLLDHDRVAQPAIVQQITQHTERGPRHYFQFYSGQEFFTEIRLCGRRLVFSGHALDRFSSRAPGSTSNTLKNLLMWVFDTPYIILRYVNDLVLFPALGVYMIGLPYKEVDGELFITTCLNVNQIHSFPEFALPLLPLNLHYGAAFTPPRIRHWNPFFAISTLKELWERKVQPPSDKFKYEGLNWGEVASMVRDVTVEEGHGPGSRLVFLDNIPGPCFIPLKAGESEPQYDELEHYKQVSPGEDWKTILAERDKLLTATEEVSAATSPTE